MTDPQTIQVRRSPDVKEVHILWITAGLGCDGDSEKVDLRLKGSCGSCEAFTQSLRLMVEQAVYDAAPDAGQVEIQTVAAI